MSGNVTEPPISRLENGPTIDEASVSATVVGRFFVVEVEDGFCKKQAKERVTAT